MGAIMNSKTRLERQRIRVAELLAIDAKDFAVLKTKSAATSRAVQVVKRVFGGGRVVQ
jgi:hypothetical protein